jgi:hypothetical protein
MARKRQNDGSRISEVLISGARSNERRLRLPVEGARNLLDAESIDAEPSAVYAVTLVTLRPLFITHMARWL